MLILLGVLVFVYNIGRGIYFLRRIEPLPAFEFLYTAAFLCGVVWWLRDEAKNSAVKRVYCEGLLVSMGWVVIIPYHLLKTRGIKGLIPLFALIAAFIVPLILVVVVHTILELVHS